VKDNFSKQSDLYKKFRPAYPPALYLFLLAHVPARDRAWDCGTGNGQVATELAKFFRHVDATDISERQIAMAPLGNNITYTAGRAERSVFPDNSFSLVTAGQAVHWFSFPEYFAEVRRTLVPNGLIALFGYARPHIEPAVDAILDRFYADILNGYWDPERHFVEERYRTIPFPFRELPAPGFRTRYDWSIDECLGYLGTWSATQHYIDRNGRDPVSIIEYELRKIWKKGESKTAVFEIFCRTGVKD
jgi:SAM-dependent methyltransferase